MLALQELGWPLSLRSPGLHSLLCPCLDFGSAGSRMCLQESDTRKVVRQLLPIPSSSLGSARVECPGQSAWLIRMSAVLFPGLGPSGLSCCGCSPVLQLGGFGFCLASVAKWEDQLHTGPCARARGRSSLVSLRKVACCLSDRRCCPGLSHPLVFKYVNLSFLLKKIVTKTFPMPVLF